MATVYLAQDLKHNRKVALKVLKPELAAVVGAERFLTEIQVTANLQHPHILPLHDSGEADSFLYYVMPYVEDETLRQLIDREKRLPVDEAVRIATAVANALDYAHRHKVVHRDIKPANILLQDGQPVVADFGIALAVGAVGGSRLTETGLSVGTPYYMSPEQATGDQAVGAASDTYALACVLYEMLVGEPPYLGNTAQAVLGKIIAGAPIAPSEQRSSIPANVDAAIRKALEKLPADRFTTAQEFSKALADPHFRYGEAETAESAAGAGPWKRIAAGLAATTVLFAGISAGLFLRPEPPEPVTRVSVRLPEDQGLVGFGTFDISRDGSLIVYEGPGGAEGSTQLWARRWDALEATPIRDTEGLAAPAVSPDGQEVAFREGGLIRVVPVRGGVSRTLGDSRCCIRWGPDGDWIYYTARDDGLSRVPAVGGPSEIVTRVDTVSGDGAHLWVDVLPGGRGAVYSATGPTGAGDLRIESVNLDTGETRVLTSGIFPRYSAGRLLFTTFEGTTLMSAPFDVERLELTGPPIPLAEGLRPRQGARAYYSVSNTGTLAYSSGSVGDVRYEPIWVTREGQETVIDPNWSFDPGSNNRGLALSPDGTELAVTILDDGNYDIWIKQLPAGPLSRLTFDDEWDVRPRWTPDGSAVAFLSRRGNSASAVYSKRASGTGDAELLMEHDLQLWEVDYTRDGEWLLSRTGGTTTVAGGRDVWGMRVGTDTVAQALVVTDFDEKAIALSPDGRWLAYESDETGGNEIYVRPFPDTEAGKWTVSTTGGVMPRWAHSGRELFYVRRRDGSGRDSGRVRVYGG